MMSDLFSPSVSTGTRVVLVPISHYPSTAARRLRTDKTFFHAILGVRPLGSLFGASRLDPGETVSSFFDGQHARAQKHELTSQLQLRRDKRRSPEETGRRTSRRATGCIRRGAR